MPFLALAQLAQNCCRVSEPKQRLGDVQDWLGVPVLLEGRAHVQLLLGLKGQHLPHEKQVEHLVLRRVQQQMPKLRVQRLYLEKDGVLHGHFFAVSQEFDKRRVFKRLLWGRVKCSMVGSIFSKTGIESEIIHSYRNVMNIAIRCYRSQANQTNA